MQFTTYEQVELELSKPWDRKQYDQALAVLIRAGEEWCDGQRFCCSWDVGDGGPT